MNNYNLFNLIMAVMDNDIDALESLHNKFNPLIVKYAALLKVEKRELVSEFDLILIKIYENNIREDFKILKYIKCVFKNYRKFQPLESLDMLNFKGVSEDIDNISDIYFDDLIKGCNKQTQNILKLRFKKQYTYEEIAHVYGVSRQCIYEKIKVALNLIKENS